MPYNQHLYVFRAIPSGQSLDFTETEFSLYDLDIHTGNWRLTSECSSSDLNLEPAERFHGYTITPTSVSLNNELGHCRLRYDLVTESWITCALPIPPPMYLGDVWGSTACHERTYFVARTRNSNKTFLMMYDHQRKRFKDQQEPDNALSGVLCHIHIDKNILDHLNPV